jgi:hypothetical protein
MGQFHSRHQVKSKYSSLKMSFTVRKSTFISFIDFKKAFDSVDRTLFLHKLSKIGIVGNKNYAIPSLFRNPKSRVILNDLATDWFECPIGVK